MTKEQIKAAFEIQNRRVDRANNMIKEISNNLVQILNSELPESFDVNAENRLVEVRSELLDASAILSKCSEILKIYI